MSFEQQQPIKITRAAEADLSSLQYHFVTVGTAGGVIGADSQGEDCLGVLQNKPTSGKDAVVVMLGVTKLKVMAAIADGGTFVVSDVTATEAEADVTPSSGEYVLGKSLHGQAAVAGDIITAMVNCTSNMLIP